MTNEREIIFIYNGKQANDRKILARTKALPAKLREIDISQESMADTALVEVAQGLDEPLEGLIDPKMIEADQPDKDGILKIISHQPDAMKTPVLVKGNLYRVIDEFSDLEAFEDAITASDNRFFQG